MTTTTTRLRLRERISLDGVIRGTTTVSVGGSPVYRCVLATPGGDLDLLFLGRAAIAGLTVGARCDIGGTVTVHRGRLAVWNPRYRLLPLPATRRRVTSPSTSAWPRPPGRPSPC